MLRRQPYRPINNQTGFTLVEVMLSALIATMIAYASFSIFPFLRQKQSGLRGLAACNAYLDSNFARIEQLGTSPRIPDEPAGAPGSYIAKIANFVPSLTTPSYPNTAYSDVPFTQSPWAGGAHRLVEFNDSNSVTTIRTSGLYTSNVVIVNALYANKGASICNSSIGYTNTNLTLGPNTLLTQSPAEISQNFKVKMVVQPINLQTQTPIPCGTGLATYNPTIQIAPKGNTTTSTEADTYVGIPPGPVAHFAVRNEIGYAVTLTASYTSPDQSVTSNNSTKSCTQTRRVAYTGDVTRPAQPSASTAYTPPAVRNPTTSGPPSVTITFKSDPTKPKRGVTLMCRDKSIYTQPFAAWKNPGVYLSNASVPTNNGKWVPCERVSACDKSPVVVAGSQPNWAGSTQDYTSIAVSWWGAQKLMYGCHINIDVVAVDAAGNVSPIYPFTGSIDDTP